MGAAERFWSKVDGGPVDTCWLWQAATTKSGYGDFYVGPGLGRTVAHRWAYEALRVEIPAGLQLDHLCRVRSCVNPWHVEPVTHAENNRRGERANRAQCPRGHAYTSANTYVAARGDRQCRACMRDRNYRAWERIRNIARAEHITIRKAREKVRVK